VREAAAELLGDDDWRNRRPNHARQYIASVAGKELFRRIYDETLSIALATGTRPERMIVEPIPPRWEGTTVPGNDHDVWIGQIIAAYGDLKPSMLQDFERGRRTEVDFINGYVAQMGKQLGIPTVMNASMTEIVHLIEQDQIQPHPARVEDVLRRAEDGVESKQRVATPS
jgi:2-dehydropantoate 2-reductase